LDSQGFLNFAVDIIGDSYFMKRKTADEDVIALNICLYSYQMVVWMKTGKRSNKDAISGRALIELT
jgi:hypothetical protein